MLIAILRMILGQASVARLTSSNLYSLGITVLELLFLIILLKHNSKLFNYLEDRGTGFKRWQSVYVWIAILSVLIGIPNGIILGFVGVAVASILPLFLYPDESVKYIFKRYGRVLTKQRTKTLLTDDNIGILAKLAYLRATNHQPLFVLVCKRDRLDDVVDTGFKLGNIKLNLQLLTVLLSNHSPYSKGIIVIRDNRIVALGCQSTKISTDLKVKQLHPSREVLELVGLATSYDVFGLVVDDTGLISLAGTLNKRLSFDYNLKIDNLDIQHGLSNNVLEQRIHNYIREVGKADIAELVAENKKSHLTRAERDKMRKDEQKKKMAERKAKREELKREREAKLAERRKRK